MRRSGGNRSSFGDVIISHHSRNFHCESIDSSLLSRPLSTASNMFSSFVTTNKSEGTHGFSADVYFDVSGVVCVETYAA